MRGRVTWTPDLDERLRDLRGGGLTWDHVATSMGLGRNTVLERGRKIGARRRPAILPPTAEAKDRPPRCAGHPMTWGLLIAGTVLDGEAYPYPVFL
jgi:hypothetical protein